MASEIRMVVTSLLDQCVARSRGLPADELEGYALGASMFNASIGAAVCAAHSLPTMVIPNASAGLAVQFAETYLYERKLPQAAGFLRAWKDLHGQLFKQVLAGEAQGVHASSELLQRMYTLAQGAAA